MGGGVGKHALKRDWQEAFIDSDLILLAQTINDLLDECEVDGKRSLTSTSGPPVVSMQGEIDVRPRKISDWKHLLKTFLVVIVMSCAVPAAAGEVSYGHVTAARVVSIYDGDTFRVDIAGWPAIIGNNIPVRVAGIDAPEIRGRCAYERDLAVQARNMAAAILQSGQPVVLGNIRRGKYFRIIADVWVGNTRLSTALIRRGLGRPYDGGRRRGWC